MSIQESRPGQGSDAANFSSRQEQQEQTRWAQRLIRVVNGVFWPVTWKAPDLTIPLSLDSPASSPYEKSRVSLIDKDGLLTLSAFVKGGSHSQYLHQHFDFINSSTEQSFALGRFSPNTSTGRVNVVFTTENFDSLIEQYPILNDRTDLYKTKGRLVHLTVYKGSPDLNVDSAIQRIDRIDLSKIFLIDSKGSRVLGSQPPRLFIQPMFDQSTGFYDLDCITQPATKRNVN